MKVLLGITGCIAAYKSILILRLLQKAGHEVMPIMTRSATRFIGPLTLEKLSGHHVLIDALDSETTRIEHIGKARQSDLLLVAPATANIIGKLASGIADDFLTTLYLSTTTPVFVAPAMNVEMWRHSATVTNVETLRQRGVTIIEPGEGYQACGETGEGRLAEPEDIVGRVLSEMERSQKLGGTEVLITAGPTVEDIDPVRFLSNRSTGKMGYALAAEAASRGARVTLVSGPTQLAPPAGVQIQQVRSAAEMSSAVYEFFDTADIVIMTAAVADFTPRQPAQRKIKKQKGNLTVEFVPTEDILAKLGERKAGQLVVGFAAETDNLEAQARAKLESKNLDLIVANPAGHPELGFGSDFNRVMIIFRQGKTLELPTLSKGEVAKKLWDEIVSLREARQTLKDSSIRTGS